MTNGGKNRNPNLHENHPALIFAGIPAANNALYHQLRFAVGDPAALIQLPDGQRIFILRDIEMQRARQQARADHIACPADYAPAEGLSGDRETATAQSAAECLIRNDIRRVIADRTFPLIFADELQARGITVDCDRELGVTQRRQKDEHEIEALRAAQAVTEQAIELACTMIGRAVADRNGVLQHQGRALTAERVRATVDVMLLERGFQSTTWIIAGGPQGADCHDVGRGELKTGQPVLVDIFPQDRATRYHGDCTRTVVHGDIPDEVQQMHRAVVAAKRAAIAACRVGVTGAAVHQETSRVILEHGFAMELLTSETPSDRCVMSHGTGHGIGLDVHEPPLLDRGGPELVLGDAVTVEPGLYCRSIGGLRIEDMIVIRQDGSENLNKLPEDLHWD